MLHSQIFKINTTLTSYLLQLFFYEIRIEKEKGKAFHDTHLNAMARKSSQVKGSLLVFHKYKVRARFMHEVGNKNVKM